MKKHNTTLLMLPFILLTAVLMLSACGSASSASPSTSSSTEAPTAPAATSASATSAPAAAGSCLVGTWQLTDLSAYMNSIEQNTASSSGGDFTLTSQKFSGAASWTFNADNTAEFSADNFEQDFTMSTTVGGQSMDIPISLKINGKSTAAYSVDGDQISFSNQEQSGLTINADVMGASTPLDTSLMGKPGTVQLYQYSCPDVNTLTLKVVAIKNVDLAPLTLTRTK